ncbi:unnamed protein product [Medioppia subpectinata]|uniref:Protein kinase domain-containing protein n=1 Tax=Medioppia subpectinata TaxID=1979941 RepID=A0A7R9PTE2_9ACAR|nr:unnamed protein product [Medioppia subpectinata]CAG2100353.1 unnamed protein product [Medioppia subpectinata]
MSGKSEIAKTNSSVATNIPALDAELLKKKGFKVGQQLNSGSFSTVCRATKGTTPVAVKIIDLSKTSEDYKNRFLPRELYTMTKLKHPNIIGIHDIFTIGNRIYVFMDLADGGDILDLIKNGAVSEVKAKPLYKGVADALKYIHSKGFAHRDIKSENILLNKTRTVAKIADFGFSRTCFDNKTGTRVLSATYCGSAAYVAPEVLKITPYNPMISDVWSMGIVLYVMVNNRLPFSDKNLRQMLKQQLDRNIEYTGALTDACKDLIGKHLEPNIQQRYTMAQVLEHRWFK